MLSKEDQIRFEQITRELRASDPRFFARLDDRHRIRRRRLMMALTIALWTAVPALAVVAGGVTGAVYALILLGNAALVWQIRRRRR
ncbi:DUF3040 domain-containing protein [Plantactinospora sp. GCM10030261]|uniref:DUF3040 domain-containing protein n=1 Tax=Plantactinospora sp. GCM10030261 TaxID=3273420 RepID=UPI00360BA839